MPRNFGFQGKRDGQVSFSQAVAGICFVLVLLCLLYAYLTRGAP